MLTGVCPYCNNRFLGIALLDPKQHKCPECGIGLLVVTDVYKPFQGYPQFTAAILDSKNSNSLKDGSP